MGGVLASLIPNVVNKVMDFVGDKFQTEDEKKQAEAKIQQAVQEQIQTAWNQEQEQLTERMKIDMTSDSWLSKNVRPLTLVYLMMLFTLAFFRDVPEQTLQLLQSLLMTVFVFYFGSRTLEKITKIVKDQK